MAPLRWADGGEVVGLAVVEAEIVEGAGADDLAEFAADQLARLDFSNLVADGDAPAGLDQLLYVTPRGVVGHAAHGHLAAFGEGDIHDRRDGHLGIFAEDFVKIAEAEKQDGLRRQITPDGVILLHHRSLLLVVRHAGSV